MRRTFTTKTKLTTMKQKQPTIIMVTAYLLFSILFLYSVIVAKKFLYPIALAMLFAYLLFPIANFLEKKGIARIIAVLISVIIGITIVAAVFFIIYKQMEGMVSDFPTLKAKALHNIEVIGTWIETNFGIEQSRQKLWLKEGVSKLFDSGNIKIGQIFGTTTGTLLRIILLPVFIFFMLYYRDKAYEFIMQVTSSENKSVVRNIIEEISHVTKHYMGGVVIVVMILCVLNSLGLYIVGIRYALMLGVIAAVCNFIPYFGTILGFAFPLVFALLTESSPKYAIGVIIVFAIVQFTENNILTPNIVGGNVRLNPFIIILSLIVGAMVWGVPGMLVIVPLMAVLRIICEHVDRLKPYAFLLGVEGTEKHSVTFAKIKRIFKRKKRNDK